MLEMMQAMALALSQKPPQHVDMMFVHGIGDLGFEVFLDAIEEYRNHRAGNLFINGTTEAESRKHNIDYIGREAYIKLAACFDIAPRYTPYAPHTYAEAATVRDICQKEGWRSVAFISSPYHILRCTLTHLAAAKNVNFPLQLYPMTIKDIDWQMPVQRKILDGPTTETTRLELLDKEWERIQKYITKGHCVTIAEMIEYYRMLNPKLYQ